MRFSCWTLLLTAVGSVASAQGATLSGSVQTRTAGLAVSGAEVSLPDARLDSRASQSGDFQISGIPAGEYLVVVRAVGYRVQRVRLMFRARDTVFHKFVMDEIATNLDTVLVSETAFNDPRLVEFEQRRAEGFGRFLTREDMVKYEHRRMSDILTLLPGARIIRGNGSDAWVASGRGRISVLRDQLPDRPDRRRGAPTACYSIVWLDGSIVYGGRDEEPLFNINNILPSDVAAIEYHVGAGQLPAKFNGSNAACGVLVVWTRMQ